MLVKTAGSYVVCIHCLHPIISFSPACLTPRSKNKTQVLAYSRRQKENDTFSDIADALPIQENAKDLDKASILRLAINYLKLRDLIQDGREEAEEEETEGLKAEEGGVKTEELSPDVGGKK